MLQATYKTGPAIGPHGRGHIHAVTIDDALGVASEATWWSTARSGGRYGLGAINIPHHLKDEVNMGVTLGGAVVGAMLGGLVLGGKGRTWATIGAGSGAAVMGFFSKVIANRAIHWKQEIAP